MGPGPTISAISRKASPRAPWVRRLAIEVGVLAAMGLAVGALAPFGSDDMPIAKRYGYWLANLLGGGLIGVAVDEGLAWRLTSPWRRVLATAVLMTPLVTLFVTGMMRLTFGMAPGAHGYVTLLWQVFAISLPAMTVRSLVWRRPTVRVETRTVIAPPMPEAEAAFRRRLSAKRRAARLIAVEAHDHYLRVHTDAGVELVAARMADALDELAGAHGYRTHRSWWVAADAIEAVLWRRGTGEARLVGGLVAPVSRAQAPTLRDAGWI